MKLRYCPNCELVYFTYSDTKDCKFCISGTTLKEVVTKVGTDNTIIVDTFDDDVPF